MTKTQAMPAPPEKAGNGQAAGSPLAAAVAQHALNQVKQPEAKDPDNKWDEMAGELYTALESKDKATFARLFRKQVNIAVREALRGNK